MHELNVSAKHTIEHFSGFWPRILWACHGFFHADDFVALRAFPESMAGTIHFVPRSKPPHINQFWCFHLSNLPTRRAQIARARWIAQTVLAPPRYHGRTARMPLSLSWPENNAMLTSSGAVSWQQKFHFRCSFAILLDALPA